MVKITRDDIIRHFGGVNNACAALQITRPSFLRWKKAIPIARLRQIEQLLNSSREENNYREYDLPDELINAWLAHLMQKFKKVNRISAIASLYNQIRDLNLSREDSILAIRVAIACKWGKIDKPNGAEKHLHLM